MGNVAKENIAFAKQKHTQTMNSLALFAISISYRGRWSAKLIKAFWNHNKNKLLWIYSGCN